MVSSVLCLYVIQSQQSLNVDPLLCIPFLPSSDCWNRFLEAFQNGNLIVLEFFKWHSFREWIIAWTQIHPTNITSYVPFLILGSGGTKTHAVWHLANGQISLNQWYRGHRKVCTRKHRKTVGGVQESMISSHNGNQFPLIIFKVQKRTASLQKSYIILFLKKKVYKLSLLSSSKERK